MAKYKIIYSIFFLTILVGCDPVDLRMKIKNNTKNDIYWDLYRDVPKEIYNPIRQKSQKQHILRKDSIMIYPRFSHWNENSESFYFLVFNADSINRYDFKKIKNDSSYQIIFMKVKDIAENNWILEIR